jgi:hypothetical protein
MLPYMRPLIPTAFAPFILCLFTISVWAGSGVPKPKRAIANLALKSIQLPDSLLSLPLSLEASDKSSTSTTERKVLPGQDKVCSCQILNLKSSNYNHRYMVLLSEKANSGSGMDFRAARNRIQMEKKQLKKLFYDKVSVVAEMQSTGSCKSLYFRLRTTDSHLQLYEILNADSVGQK